MLILKHLKNTPTCFDHYSDHLQGIRKFLVKVSDFNKELTNSLKMIWIMIEACRSVLSVLILTF